MKLSTIDQVVEAILAEAPGEEHKKVLANEAVIYYKTAMICEYIGIEAAMDYYFGTHDGDEYQEFRTSVVAPEHTGGEE